MFFKTYNICFRINPSLKIWGIYFFVSVAVPAYAQKTPQQQLGSFFSWLSKPSQVPDENDCFEGEGYDITKIDDKCLQKYLSTLQKTGLFSTIYIKSLKAEFAEKKALLAKKEIAERLGYDRYLLSQDPPSSAQLLYALKSNSFTKTDKTKAKVTVNLKKPYVQTLIYNFDWEENTWRISSVETKE